MATVTIKCSSKHNDMGYPKKEIEQQICELLIDAGYDGNYNASLGQKVKATSFTQGKVIVKAKRPAGILLVCHPSGHSNDQRYEITLSVPADKVDAYFEQLKNTKMREIKILHTEEQLNALICKTRGEQNKLGVTLNDYRDQIAETSERLQSLKMQQAITNKQMADLSKKAAETEANIANLNDEEENFLFELEVIKEKKEKEKKLDELIVQMKNLGFTAEEIASRLK